jgi:hypothetical protein
VGKTVARQASQATSWKTAKRLDLLTRLLGYQQRATFVTQRSGTRQYLSNHVVRQALTTIGISGVFGLEDGFHPTKLKPIVYLACAEDADALRALRKDVWSQGAVPFLIAVMPDKVEICSGFQPPSAPTISVEYDPQSTLLPDSLANFSADRISSSITWSDFDIHREASIDNNLVNAIETLNEKARSEFPTFQQERNLINALIGKFIYIYVLIDRRILSTEWLLSRLRIPARKDGLLFLRAIFADESTQTDSWTTQAAQSVFDVVDDAINGSVFALSTDQWARVPNELCHLIHRVVRCGEILYRDGSQLGFFNVSFNILRTETISAIYERFVSIEDAERKKDDGVFYTPPHLADHMLDRIEAVNPITETSRLIDPAAGSGIFLVGAYRRLMERYMPADGWYPRDINRAKSLLLNVIHGIEKHRQAANVCRFSLYLTLLDYVGRASIEELVKAAGREKFLPDLSNNIRSGDAFAATVPLARYTHVVGNPPWPMSGGQRDRTNQGVERRDESPALLEFVLELKSAKLAFGHNRLSDLFTWLAVRRFAAQGATIAYVLPAHSVIGRSASNFAHCLARNVTVSWIGNLSHLRRKLFDGVEAPACVVVAENRIPSGYDKAAVYRPLLTSLPGGRKNEIWSLLASSVDVRAIRSQDLQRGPNGWFVQSMLGEFDSRMHEALKTWSLMNHRTLGDFLDRSNLLISKGGSPSETGIVRKVLGHKKVQLHVLTRVDLQNVNPDYRGWFSGNVILIPRSLNEATYFRDPVAYPSTFNAVIPKSQYQNSIDRPISVKDMPYLSQDSVNGFLSYINSDVLKYFASLFGASYLMDKARLEKNDLLALPCPFTDMQDPKLLALRSSEFIDEGILDAMNAGADFKAAFSEFSDFRKYFANAQVPPGSFNAASERARKMYLDRLIAEVQASFGPAPTVKAAIKLASSRQIYVAIAFGKKPKLDTSIVDVTGKFLGNSIVTYHRQSDTSLIVKSPTRHAWTIDQAVADAVALSREIRSPRA